MRVHIWMLTDLHHAYLKKRYFRVFSFKRTSDILSKNIFSPSLFFFFFICLHFRLNFDKRALVKSIFGGIFNADSLLGSFYIILAPLSGVSPKTAYDGLY